MLRIIAKWLRKSFIWEHFGGTGQELDFSLSVSVLRRISAVPRQRCQMLLMEFAGAILPVWGSQPRLFQSLRGTTVAFIFSSSST